MKSRYSKPLIWHIPTLAARLGWSSYYFTYLDISRTFQLLQQKAELELLVIRARRKRIKVGIRRYYEGIYQTTVQNLANKKRRLGRKFVIVQVTYHLLDAILPAHKYSRGSAKKYRSK